MIIVGNKIDDHPLDLDRLGLQAKYPNIKGFIGTSSATGLGIGELKQKIVDIIANEMPHVFDPIPLKWQNLKEKLEQDDRDYITYQEYEQKCIETGITRESSKALAQLLHELGIILNFNEDIRLQNIVVLNPEWAIVGAYKIINDNLLMTAHHGVLHWQDTDRIFQPKSRKEQDCYATEEARKFILRMMEKFELCFEMENSYDQDYPEYLIPDLLPKEEPHTGTWGDCLRFEYHYAILPNSIISRFIVKTHKLIARTNNRTYWRTGVILESQYGNRAYVKADLDDAKIFIHIDGNLNTRRAFLSIIRNAFDEIHHTFSILEVDERIPLPDNPNITVSYNHLLKLEQMGTTDYFPEGSDRAYTIHELLNIPLQNDYIGNLASLDISFDDPTLHDWEREAETMNLLEILRNRDDIETVERVRDNNMMQGVMSAPSFLNGLLSAEVNIRNLKQFIGFLGERLFNKQISVTVKANGKQVKVTANSQEDLEFAINQAQEFLNS